MNNIMGLYDQLNTQNNGMWTNADANQMLGAYDNSMLNSQNDFLGMGMDGWNTTGNMLSGIGSIGNIALGFKGLGLMEDQVDLAQDKWGETKAELNRMRGTRNKLNTNYMG